ncbi:MAG: protein BatD, partial [Muribaculum sp.]|nr:protein BatD [Muribaculum sp.]
YLNAHDNDKFYDEMLRALWGYLSDKLAIPASQLTRDNIAQQLESYGASQELTASLIGIIDECEMARYSPAKSDEQIEQLFQHASKAMNDMESLKRVKR